MNTYHSHLTPKKKSGFKWLKIILFVGLAGLIIGGAAIFYIFNKPHRDIAGSNADFSINAASLLQEFEQNEDAANGKYLDKIISVKGTITAIETTPDGSLNIALKTNSDMATVSCAMLPAEKEKAARLQEGDEITVKGLCTGMLLDVVLTNCSIQ